MKKEFIAEITESEEEIWSSTLFSTTRDEIIAEGMKEAKREGLSSFRIGEKESIGMSNIDVERVLEYAQDSLYDEVGEIAIGNYLDDVTDEQEKELEEKLNEVFYEWHKKHNLFPTCFHIKNEEVIEVE